MNFKKDGTKLSLSSAVIALSLLVAPQAGANPLDLAPRLAEGMIRVFQGGRSNGRMGELAHDLALFERQAGEFGASSVQRLLQRELRAGGILRLERQMDLLRVAQVETAARGTTVLDHEKWIDGLRLIHGVNDRLEVLRSVQGVSAGSMEQIKIYSAAYLHSLVRRQRGGVDTYLSLLRQMGTSELQPAVSRALTDLRLRMGGQLNDREVAASMSEIVGLVRPPGWRMHRQEDLLLDLERLSVSSGDRSGFVALFGHQPRAMRTRLDQIVAPGQLDGFGVRTYELVQRVGSQGNSFRVRITPRHFRIRTNLPVGTEQNELVAKTILAVARVAAMDLKSATLSRRTRSYAEQILRVIEAKEAEGLSLLPSIDIEFPWASQNFSDASFFVNRFRRIYSETLSGEAGMAIR